MTSKSSVRNGIKAWYILSYKSPNYTRTETLVSALQKVSNVELTVIKNKRTGFLRYPETLLKLAICRMKGKADVCIVGFRGHETFWLFYPFISGSEIIFDEFINMHDWLVEEHKKLREGMIISTVDRYMRWVFGKSTYILSDTPAHALLSANLYGVPTERFKVVPVGADEELFKPIQARKSEAFEVFFYGSLLPLHGLNVILEAIQELNTSGRIEGMHFTLVGGNTNSSMITKIKQFIAYHNLTDYITHIPWVDYNDLPKYIARSDLCLGGPFGGTGQAQRVITGKTYQFMAMEKPVIIGETQNDAMFKDRADCLIVAQNNPAALAQAVWWAKTHNSMLSKISKNARQLYLEKFSVKQISSVLGALINT